MLLIVFQLTVIGVAIRPLVDTSPMFVIIFPLTVVGVAIRPLEDTSAIHLIVFPLTVIGEAIRPYNSSASSSNTILKPTLIKLFGLLPHPHPFAMR